MFSLTSKKDRRIRELEEELAATKSDLQSLSDSYDRASAKLASAEKTPKPFFATLIIEGDTIWARSVRLEVGDEETLKALIDVPGRSHLVTVSAAENVLITSVRVGNMFQFRSETGGVRQHVIGAEDIEVGNEICVTARAF